MPRVCVFCGSSPGTDPGHLELAREVGRDLARRGLGVVYGGGRAGLMGAVADGALAEGGEVVGVIPEFMVGKELAHAGVGDMRVVGSMHERKALMAELSEGFLALPGGIGTLEEICEIFTWAVLDLHAKPCALLNAGGFYDQLVGFLDLTVERGFLKQRRRDLLWVESDAAAAVERIARRIAEGSGGPEDLRNI